MEMSREKWVRAEALKAAGPPTLGFSDDWQARIDRTSDENLQKIMGLAIKDRMYGESLWADTVHQLCHYIETGELAYARQAGECPHPGSCWYAKVG